MCSVYAVHTAETNYTNENKNGCETFVHTTVSHSHPTNKRKYSSIRFSSFMFRRIIQQKIASAIPVSSTLHIYKVFHIFIIVVVCAVVIAITSLWINIILTSLKWARVVVPVNKHLYMNIYRNKHMLIWFIERKSFFSISFSFFFLFWVHSLQTHANNIPASTKQNTCAPFYVLRICCSRSHLRRFK